MWNLSGKWVVSGALMYARCPVGVLQDFYSLILGMRPEIFAFRCFEYKKITLQTYFVIIKV